MSKEELKGKYGKNCNRTSCQRPQATWYNFGSYSYYCESCALMLNEENNRESMRLLGHSLCVEVRQ